MANHSSCRDYYSILIAYSPLSSASAGRSRAHENSAAFSLRALIPTWVTGLAFISGNLGALELSGMAPAARNTASQPHFYWVGAIRR